MKTKILEWNRVTYTRVIPGRPAEKDFMILPKIIKCEKKDHAIRAFCDWLNNELLYSYYAKKDELGAAITICERSTNRKVCALVDFEFYNTNLMYDGKICRAFTNINTDYIQKIIFN